MNKSILLMGLALTGQAAAVNTSNNGLGETLIYPYYTVNNNFNTFYQVINTTADAKAIKIKFLEGQNSRSVLTFNVYLAPYDVWFGHLSAAASTVSGHVGESSVLHVTDDPSCSPFLNTTGQEFLPFAIDQDAPNNNLSRATEGHIEVIEMGTLTGASADAVLHDGSGLPVNCDALQNAWLNGGYWQQDASTDMGPASGGLMGNVTLLNVPEGQSTAYQALALEQFWQSNGLHTEPAENEPDLGHAFPESILRINGQLVNTSWPSGAMAVSAALMQQRLINEFNLQSHIWGRSEWVISHPTKYLHVNDSQTAPFSSQWDGAQACERLGFKVWDNAQIDEPQTSHQACYSVNIAEISLAGSQQSTASGLLGSLNGFVVQAPTNQSAAEFGWGQFEFGFDSQWLSLPNDQILQGLPTVGFAIQSYSNAAAPAGVLAQYMGLYPHKGFTSVIDDLIFQDGFDD